MCVWLLHPILHHLLERQLAHYGSSDPLNCIPSFIVVPSTYIASINLVTGLGLGVHHEDLVEETGMGEATTQFLAG